MAKINRTIIPANNNDAFVVSKTIAFDGSAGNGATGTVPLFTVSGDVLVRVFGYVTETGVSAGGGTIAIGTASNSAGLIGATNATALATGDVFTSGGTPPGVGILPNAPSAVVGGADIIATVATANVTDGTVKFYCIWRPLSSDGSVVAS